MPERIAKNVVDRVEARAEDRWSIDKLNQETRIELIRLQEDINGFTFGSESGSMVESNVGETRTTKAGDYAAADLPRT